MLDSIIAFLKFVSTSPECLASAIDAEVGNDLLLQQTLAAANRPLKPELPYIFFRAL